jgi:hypothetical protein
LLQTAIQTRLDAGQSLRGAEFSKADETGRSAHDEVTEQAILAMIDAVDERRLPYIANFYTALYFDNIDSTSIHTLASLVNTMNYRAICLLKIIGEKVIYSGKERLNTKMIEYGWEDVDYVVAMETYSLYHSNLILCQPDDSVHAEAILGYGGLLPKNLLLDTIGQSLFERMELSTMADCDPALVETLESLNRIGAAHFS